MAHASYLPETWFDPRLEVRPSPIHEFGLFGTGPFRQGEIIMIWGGTLYTQEDMDAGRVPDNYACSLTESGLLLCGQDDLTDRYINHSCDPNIWMDGDTHLVARRDIPAGEEITGDFVVWDMISIIDPCRCGSPHCRGRFTNQDWKLPELQARYQGHFLPYIARCISEHRSEFS